jgi:hypothetical protein
MPRLAELIAVTTPAGVEAVLAIVMVSSVIPVLLDPPVRVRVIALVEIVSSVAVIDVGFEDKFR